MSTHIGKIGRLSRDIRQLLGEKIEDGIPNKDLVAWLNESVEVKRVLALRFEGRAITEQNLSEWKQTGHVEWLRREERRVLALQLVEPRSGAFLEPEELAAEKEVSDRLGRELGLEMARLALALVEQDGNTEERWKRLCAVYREVSRLRRDDERGDRTRIQRERWERERAKLDAKQRIREESGGWLEPIRLATEELRTETKANRQRRAELGRRSKSKRVKCSRKGKANDELRMANGGKEASGADIEQPTFNAQRPRGIQAAVSAKAMEDKAARRAGSKVKQPKKGARVRPAEEVATVKHQCDEGQVAAAGKASGIEGNGVNPGKSNQIQAGDLRGDEHAGGPPALLSERSPMANGVEEGARDERREEIEVPQAEEIRPNPASTQRYTDEENEAWLRKMNFI
jgi:hypothetical protein